MNDNTRVYKLHPGDIFSIPKDNFLEYFNDFTPGEFEVLDEFSYWKYFKIFKWRFKVPFSKQKAISIKYCGKEKEDGVNT